MFVCASAQVYRRIPPYSSYFVVFVEKWNDIAICACVQKSLPYSMCEYSTLGLAKWVVWYVPMYTSTHLPLQSDTLKPDYYCTGWASFLCRGSNVQVCAWIEATTSTTTTTTTANNTMARVRNQAQLKLMSHIAGSMHSFSSLYAKELNWTTLRVLSLTLLVIIQPFF